MIIVIIAEPRSGSTNLALWFRNLRNIDLLYEPISNPNMKWFKDNEPIANWKFQKEIVVIKETFNGTSDFSELITIADKIIFLHRENYIEQLESFTHAMVSNNWDGVWLDADFDKSKIENFESLFSNIKNKYKQFRNNCPIGIEVSYEGLYFNSQIIDVIKYLELPKLTKYKFPINQKYRVTNEKRSII
jgi:LPS sulfotransferase NodH